MKCNENVVACVFSVDFFFLTVQTSDNCRLPLVETRFRSVLELLPSTVAMFVLRNIRKWSSHRRLKRRLQLHTTESFKLVREVSLTFYCALMAIMYLNTIYNVNKSDIVVVLAAWLV